METRLTDATIVLVHGLAVMRPADLMFTGVSEALESKGYRVARTLVQGDGRLDELAGKLWPQLAALDGPLVLLCHSMGGLQSRTFLLDDNKARRIRAIATMGSPHQGTHLTYVASAFGKAYRDMTPDARADWMKRNGETERATAERYQIRCISAVAAVEKSPRHSQLLIPHALLRRVDGPNDGLVSARSQHWAQHAFEVDLDHLECAQLRSSTRGRSSIAAWVRLAEIASATQ